MLEFQKQNCQLTLEEGLKVYYEAFEDQGSILRGDTLPEFIFGHDCTHVIFGLGLSLKEEAILDTYTIYGCKNSLKIIFKAAGQIFKSKELLNLYKKLIVNIDDSRLKKISEITYDIGCFSSYYTEFSQKNFIWIYPDWNSEEKILNLEDHTCKHLQAPIQNRVKKTSSI